MRTLCYLDPLVEGSLPEWKAGWVWPARAMMQAIRASADDATEPLEFICICSEVVLPVAQSVLSGCASRAIPQDRLVPGLGTSSLELAVEWSRPSPDPERLHKMADLVRAACPDGPPDVCITFSPVPFIRLAFPDCLIIHRENGMFSVPPFASTMYLDSRGMQTQSTLSLRAVEIADYRPTRDEFDLIEAIRTHYVKRLFGPANPLKEWAEQAISGFERAVLLSLQAEAFYSYVAYAQFPNQYDLLAHTLSSVPDTVAVICTEHPRFPAVPEASIRALQRQYPNLIWDPILRNVDGASQHLMDYVDTVITVSSSIGFQALMWHKRLIVAGSSQLDFIAASHDVRDAARSGAVDPSTCDNILTWLLTRYFLPTSLIHGGDFLLSHIRRERTRMSSEAGARFDPAPVNLQALKRAHITSNLQRDESFVGRFDATPPTQMVVFTAEDCEGFSDATCFVYRASILAEWQRIRLAFPVNGRDIRHLRLDPTNRAEALEMREITVLGDGDTTLWSWRTGKPLPEKISGIVPTDLDGSTLFTCITDNPQITIEWPAQSRPRQSIVVELDIRQSHSLERLVKAEASVVELGGQLESLRRECERERARLDEATDLTRAYPADFAHERTEWRTTERQRREEMEALAAENEALRKQAESANGEVAAMRRTVSWRVTAPLRHIRRLSRR
ncbi:hypothetical protein BPUN_3401 [Candidatus Paraburkholderia kirkii]|nr:hypothetical protein BPUN_3401 [Candidatus Paraburkholderia kirkii]